MCDFAVKLTLTPGAMGEPDVTKIKEVGLNNEQVTVAVQVISYFNYINRIADGLGVEDEDFMKQTSHEEWLEKKAKFV